MAIAQTETPKINDKREIFGWAMYDWANSAFSTTDRDGFPGPVRGQPGGPGCQPEPG